MIRASILLHCLLFIWRNGATASSIRGNIDSRFLIAASCSAALGVSFVVEAMLKPAVVLFSDALNF